MMTYLFLVYRENHSRVGRFVFKKLYVEKEPGSCFVGAACPSDDSTSVGSNGFRGVLLSRGVAYLPTFLRPAVGTLGFHMSTLLQ